MIALYYSQTDCNFCFWVYINIGRIRSNSRKDIVSDSLRFEAKGSCDKVLKLIMHTVGVSLFEFIAHTKLYTQFKTIRTIPTNHP